MIAAIIPGDNAEEIVTTRGVVKFYAAGTVERRNNTY
jgi:hypothetical protein